MAELQYETIGYSPVLHCILRISGMKITKFRNDLGRLKPGFNRAYGTRGSMAAAATALKRWAVFMPSLTGLIHAGCAVFRDAIINAGAVICRGRCNRCLAMLWCLPLCGCAVISRTSERSKHPAIQSIADPKFLEEYATTRRFSAGYPTAIKIVPDGSAVLFLRSGPRDNIQNLYEFDTRTGEERVVLTAEQILQGAEEKLSAEEKARRERMRQSARGIAGYQLSEDGSKILVPLSGRLFVIDRLSRDVKELTSDKGFPIDPRFSPDARSVACVRDGNLFVIDIALGEERQMTSGANENVSFGTAEFVAQEEMDRREGYWWSPDSQQILYQRTDTAGMETMHIMDAMYPEKPPQTWAYPRTGKKNADVQLGIMPAAGGETTWIKWDSEKHPYVATVRWKDGPPLLLVQNREQTEEILFQIDPATGTLKDLLREQDSAWVNLDDKMPRWTAANILIWSTEREGSTRLEFVDVTANSRAAIEQTSEGFKGFLHIDRVGKAFYFLASPEPTQTHVIRVDGHHLNTAPKMTVSKSDGVHNAIFAENSQTFVLSSNTLAGRREYIVYGGPDQEVGRLRSVAEEPPFVPNLEIATVGELELRAAIIRPRNFNPKLKYPVIDSVYGGPHSQTVQAAARNYLLQQWIADHGFIVVSIDGRGTPSRGRDWERAIKGNLIEIPLEDQVAGLRALGEKYPEMDMSRVGIYGWSFGGYFAAMAVMRRPDVFHVGVAGAPVADWRDYDTHYTERYMGLPEENPAGYEAASVLTYCKDLERPLLIVHGTADDNVYFMHALKMSNALFRAGKHHELLPLSDFTHMVADPLVTTRLYERITGFLAENLQREMN
jgi:dipeptidyl-peptidase 4